MIAGCQMALEDVDERLERKKSKCLLLQGSNAVVEDIELESNNRIQLGRDQLYSQYK